MNTEQLKKWLQENIDFWDRQWREEREKDADFVAIEKAFARYSAYDETMAMVHILEKQVPWELELECMECDTRILACADDVSIPFWSNTSPVVCCPKCGNVIKINANAIPETMMRRLVTE